MKFFNITVYYLLEYHDEDKTSRFSCVYELCAYEYNKKKQITTEVSISVLSYQQLNEFKQDDPSYIFTNGGGWCKVTVTVMPTECASLTYWFHATTELVCE